MRLASFFAALIGCAAAVGAAAAGKPDFKLVHSFDGADGAYVDAKLVQAPDGNFYGAAGNGGCSDCVGTVFRMTPAGKVKLVHEFRQADGLVPNASLVLGTDGRLYGTTQSGGNSLECTGGNCGTVFRLSTSGKFEVLHTFATYNEGVVPVTGLAEGADGLFYGATEDGGEHGLGTIFSISRSGRFHVVHSIDFDEGQQVRGPLMRANDGQLYGTFYVGGPAGFGSVFRVTASGSVEVMHAFDRVDPLGTHPVGGLVQGSDGALYGVTLSGANPGPGCPFGCGAFYRITLQGEASMVHNFLGSQGGEGAGAFTPPTQAPDGNWYGTTWLGGEGVCEFDVSGCGTVYRIDPNGRYKTLHRFSDQPSRAKGVYPRGGLLLGIDGALYGTTSQGGAGNVGTAFKIDLN